MTRDYLDKWLRERRLPLSPATMSVAAPTPWGTRDTDPSWEWDSVEAAATARANGATGELPHHPGPTEGTFPSKGHAEWQTPTG